MEHDHIAVGNNEKGLHMAHQHTHTCLAATAAVLLLLAAGCGQSETAAPVTFDKDNVTFTGANSITYQKAWDSTTNDIARKMLIDEQITDAEFDQARERYSDCMANFGYTITYEGTNGERQDRYPNTDWEQITKNTEYCQAQTAFDYIELLHNLNGYDSDQDTVTPLVECLKRHGIADRNMTADQYKDIVSDPQTDAKIFGKYFDETRDDYDAEQSPAYWACNADPNS
ncbi:hypothetical protein [Bifidobacterium cuniculi]|uniref:Uncharacterized protein n=1 Tax=Bifidobacterium cuniculi TaxID=1688 RepID=A0A087AT36_9BIFI|nr:hypothetical protein [Bifidobacterium cuniculi]KFI61936.1 hypothetical protein BCUN_1841 [Bifidobacterium cuniculi]